MANLHQKSSDLKSTNLEYEDRHRSVGADDRSTESREDYLVCIFELIEEKGYARVANVAESLAVAEPSASARLRRWSRIRKLHRFPVVC
jgi:hypothetical protein